MANSYISLSLSLSFSLSLSLSLSSFNNVYRVSSKDYKCLSIVSDPKLQKCIEKINQNKKQTFKDRVKLQLQPLKNTL